ncbi:hypothetical protein ABZ154_19670 [Streptomyces sp. NPDC006261]|uniref:hypothetical protein n=1 Tax=Streptomyces sp. NPDC006261 TaxID=3156739 RepID=UPI0033B19A55
MDEVRSKARASKAILHRRWHHETHLVAAALEQSGRIHIDAVDTGTLAGDLDEVAVRAGADGLLGSMLSQRAVTGAGPDTAYLRSYFTCVVLPGLDHRPR